MNFGQEPANYNQEKTKKFFKEDLAKSSGYLADMAPKEKLIEFFLGYQQQEEQEKRKK